MATVTPKLKIKKALNEQNLTVPVGASQVSAVGASQVSAVGASQVSAVGANQVSAVGASQVSAVGASQVGGVGVGGDSQVGASSDLKTLVVENALLKAQIASLEHQLLDVKTHLRRYTFPEKNKRYYQNHRAEIIAKQVINNKKFLAANPGKAAEYNRRAYLKGKAKKEQEKAAKLLEQQKLEQVDQAPVQETQAPVQETQTPVQETQSDAKAVTA